MVAIQTKKDKVEFSGKEKKYKTGSKSRRKLDKAGVTLKPVVCITVYLTITKFFTNMSAYPLVKLLGACIPG